MSQQQQPSPNHALQRTAPAVTLAASAAALPPTMQPARQPPQSLSLGALGDFTQLFFQRTATIESKNRMRNIRLKHIIATFCAVGAFIGITELADAQTAPIVGVWEWGGGQIVTINEDGTCRSNYNTSGTWTGNIKRHMYRLEWKEGWIDSLTLTGGNNDYLVGTNQYGGPATTKKRVGAKSIHANEAPQEAHEIKVTGSYKHNSAPGTWSRGMATTMYCGNSPESWIRGNASLDPTSGILTMTVQLETDSTSAGPKGKVTALLKDAAGKTLATATSDEIGTGGKPPGKAAIRNFTSHAKIDPTIAGRVTSIYLDAECTGSIDRIWNVRLGTVQDAFNIAVMVSRAL